MFRKRKEKTKIEKTKIEKLNELLVETNFYIKPADLSEYDNNLILNDDDGYILYISPIMGEDILDYIDEISKINKSIKEDKQKELMKIKKYVVISDEELLDLDEEFINFFLKMIYNGVIKRIKD